MENTFKATQNSQFDSLRLAAEKTIREAADPAYEKVDGILQELQVQQIELEMQNDELRNANEEIELQRIKFQNIYDLAPVGYFIIDARGFIDEVNTAGMHLLETGKAGIRSKSLQSFVAPNQRDRFYIFLRELLHGNGPHSCQLKFVTKGGREFYALLEGGAVSGSLSCYIAMIDVTEITEARLALAETKDRLELALDASGAGTWELHIPTMRFYMDEANHYTWRTGEKKLPDSYKAFIDLVHPDDRFNTDQCFRTAINTGCEIDIVTRFINKAGETCFANIRGHLVPGGDAGGEKRFVGIISDITEKKKLEEKAELQELERQREIALATLHAEEKERKRISESLHDSVSQLLYGIKIQLGQINGDNRVAVAAKLNNLLDIAIKETRNISFELAPQTLADYGLETAVTELCDRLNTPQMRISSIVTGFDKRGDLQLENLLFRLAQELVNNCMKHSAASQVRISLKKNARQVELSVTDNGIGFIVPETEQKLHGTGLSSIRNRIQLFNGTLLIDSLPGKGTTVKVVIDNSLN